MWYTDDTDHGPYGPNHTAQICGPYGLDVRTLRPRCGLYGPDLRTICLYAM
ncbi:hypothetical protein DPMN_163212 [Dreissena polymorpha]|uniref:Uncharacterized protein n=1 Tax=Dreissena polymorpha TaxID=45954 RepID=A0A9D4ERP0_DREPO|nr:hypothetical protein DPMN_163212 [Dreissena polymorpha]